MGIYIDLLNENYFNIIFNEAYFGKTQGMIALERKISVCRLPYLGQKWDSSKIYTNPDIAELERMLSKEFGFRNLFLEIKQFGSINAFTYPIDIFIEPNLKNPRQMVETSSTGWKFTQYAGAVSSIHIASEIWMDPEFTDAEVLAILLHEIGHNFESFMNNNLRCFSTAIAVINLITSLCGNIFVLWKSTSGIKEFKNEVNKAIKRTPVTSMIFWCGNSIKSLLNKMILELDGILRVGTLGMSTILAGLLKYATTLIDYNKLINLLTSIIIRKPGVGKEHLSDNFASMYGYGNELIIALEKMNMKSKSAAMRGAMKIPALNTIIDTLDYPGILLLSLLDPHPQNVTRAKFMIESAEKELDNELNNPRLKKELKFQLQQMKESQEKYYETIEQLPKNLIVQRAVIHWLNNKELKPNAFDDINQLNNNFKINMI